MIPGCKYLAASGLAVACLFAADARALAQAEKSTPEIWFDIPAQPLVSALQEYNTKTGIAGLYAGNLVKGRVSGAIIGRYTPSVALRLMLQGSSLSVQYAAPNAFVIVRARGESSVTTAASSIANAAISEQDAVQRDYSGLLQAKVNDALCARPTIRPGDYRVALKFRIDPDGHIRQFKLLASSGADWRDRAIVDALQGMVVGEAPPAFMAQPFTMIILPMSSGGAADCLSVGASRGHG